MGLWITGVYGLDLHWTEGKPGVSFIIMTEIIRIRYIMNMFFHPVHHFLMSLFICSIYVIMNQGFIALEADRMVKIMQTLPKSPKTKSFNKFK